MKTRALVLLFVVSFGLHHAFGRPMVGVNSLNQIFTFDSTTPGTISAPVAITGLVSGDAIQGIDFRPANGVLYALGINNTAGNDTGRIYTIDIPTAVATVVGAAPFSTALTDGASYGFDFNPTNDRIRVVNTGDQNMRLNPDTGAVAGFDTNLTASAVVVGAAYDRSDRNPATLTTLFGIDSFNNTLVRIGGIDGTPSPNGGLVTTIGALGVTLNTANVGFDIAEDGVAYASLSTLIAGTTTYRLYTVNLSSGVVSAVANIGTGITAIRGIAAVPSAVANIDSGKFFTTIQAAISDAQTVGGNTIVVNAGTFNELVTVNKSVTLLGAKSGIDARSSARGTFETVVRGANPAGGRTTAFHVTFNNAVIDGFTVQEAANGNQFGAGIVLGPSIAGTQIRNNIIQNNVAGLIISSSTPSNPLIIERNLFTNNNLSGPLSGTAIYTDQFQAGSTFSGVVIDNNSFTDNANVGVLLGSTLAGTQSNVIISNNSLVHNGNGILLFNLATSFVTGNFITNSIGSQLVVGGGVSDLDISENVIDAGATRGIRVGNFGGGSTNTNILIGSNSITNNPNAGLEIDSAANAYTGTLIAQSNWWGDATGPMIATNPGGTGQKLIDPATQVSFLPFLFTGSDTQVGASGFQCYPAPILYGINSANNNLIHFASDNLGTMFSTTITGLVGGDIIVGLDFRPATGELFGLGSGGRLYVITPATGAAVQHGPAFTPIPGTAFGFDFNPITDFIRVTSDTQQNRRLNPNDGTVITDVPLAYPAGDPGFGLTPNAGGLAFLNNFFGTTRTTLYDIDTAANVLVRQGSFGAPTPESPNSGKLFTVGSLGIDPVNDANTAFDIASPVPGVNLPFAALTTNGTSSRLYRINLVTGEATDLGIIGASIPLLVRALTAAPTGDFAFSAPSYSVGESGPVATITINRLHGSEGSVTVQFTTRDGTAVAGVDYTNSDQLVTFPNGVTSKTVTIPIVNDGIDEFNETILLRLSGAFNSTQATATLTITDDDLATPTLTAQSSSTAAVGEAIFDVATISSSSFLGGTLTFQLFGPNDSSCGTPPIFTSTVPVNGNGNYASASFTPTTPGAYRWIVSYSGDVDHNTMVNTGCNGLNQTFAATATVLGNIASRLRVETGDNVLIAGFIVTGTQTKKVIVRGIGTSLPLAGNLQDPMLELHDGSGGLIEMNDNWVDSPNKQAIIGSGLPPASDFESVIVAFLPANNSLYTAILRGANNSTGIGVVEAYDLDRLVDSELGNISTRGFVSTGDNVLIAGTIVVGKNPQNVIVRAIGPSLPLQGKMDDPILELHDGNGGLIEVNDNWVDSPNKQAIINTGLPPADNRESAILATLPGNSAGYTAIVRGVNNTVGIAVVEVYALP